MENKQRNTMLVIDVGTQSLRASIIDDNGNFVIVVKRSYKEPYISPKSGYCEKSPDFYYETICNAVNEIKQKMPKELAGVKGLTVTAFRDTAAMLDKDCKPVCDSILWLDQRNAKLEKKLKWYNSLAFWFVGMKDTVNYNRKRTVAVWMQENKPDLWEKVQYYVPITAYWNFLLVGKLVDSTANCTGHYPFNFKKGKWYGPKHPKSDIFQIRQDQLCKLVEVGGVIGKITKKCSEESGIPEGLPVYATGTDKGCETFGNGCLTSNHVSVSYGTACTIDVPSKKYVEPEKFLPAYLASYKGSYNIENQVYRGYWMIRWFIQEFAEEDKKIAQKYDISIEDFLDNKIIDIEPGSNGLILQPYWGPGLKRPLARGAIIGFSDIHTKYHLYKAIIEGIGFALREGLDVIYHRMRKIKKVEYIVLSGGGATNDNICQITADLFNITVKRTATVETSSIGAAMSGFISCGVFKDEEEAVNKMVKYVAEFKPNKENAKKYNYLYHNVYRTIYPRLNSSYAELKGFSSNEIN